MSWTKLSCNSELYSEHQTVYTLRVKNGHLSILLESSSCIQSQGERGAQIKAAEVNSLLSATLGGMKTHSKNNFVF